MVSIAPRISLLVLALGLLAFGCSAPVSALDASQSKAISSNCSAIKQSLNQLQKVDSKTRTYLGTTYETIANRFITPLNLRLVRNNRPTLSAIQSDFFAEQTKFRDGYTNYMRELENLIAIDCQNESDKFYTQLKLVRDYRAKVRLATEELNQLTQDQYNAVLKLRKEL